MVETQPTPGSARRRPQLNDVARRVLITVLIVGSLVGIGLTGRAAVTGTDVGSSGVPDSVDRLIPVRGGEVPRQSAVGIDVAEGHDAYLVVNGVEIRSAADGLVRDLGTGVITFQPGPGRAIETLQSGQNCVVARVWDQLESDSTAVPVSWCFNAF